jgi:hypothetical protein
MKLAEVFFHLFHSEWRGTKRILIGSELDDIGKTVFPLQLGNRLPGLVRFQGLYVWRHEAHGGDCFTSTKKIANPSPKCKASNHDPVEFP